MLLMEHMSDINHILDELEQIEKTEFTDRLDIEPLQHSRLVAKDVIVDFMQLLHNLEAEDFVHSGIIYDSEMIEAMCLTAYYMSRYDHRKLFGMGYTLEETCEETAKIIACNVEALLHMKNLYDEFFANNGVGSHESIQLTHDMRRVMELGESMTEEEVARNCQRWLKR